MNQPPTVQHCQPGSYPWDFWQTRALEAELARELAVLGRAVMREAAQHNWRPRLQAECGWNDDGEEMLELALSKPVQAAKRWEHLLVTDGETLRRNPRTGMLESRD
jgi:hypothetical protein